MKRTTMRHLSYGLIDPSDLLDKLRNDASKLSADPHPYDVFNFIVTAAVLSEWIFKAHAGHPTVDAIATANEKCSPDLLPVICAHWIIDHTCIPNRHCDIRRHIMNALRICWETANASKHFHWTGSSSIKAIEPKPIIGSYYQYCFTSRQPDLYIDYGGECYGLSQLKAIIVQFHAGFLNHVNSTVIEPM